MPLNMDIVLGYFDFKAVVFYNWSNMALAELHVNGLLQTVLPPVR